MRTAVAPWIGLLLGPMVFLTNLELSFAAAGWVCATKNDWLLHLSHIISLALVGWSALVAHRVWQASGGGASSEDGEVASRDHFLGLLGLMVALFSAALLVAQWIPEFLLGACQ